MDSPRVKAYHDFRRRFIAEKSVPSTYEEVLGEAFERGDPLAQAIRAGTYEEFVLLQEHLHDQIP